VQGLVDHKEYLFRVAAANANGAGDWLEMPSSIIAKMPFGELPNFVNFLQNAYFLPECRSEKACI